MARHHTCKAAGSTLSQRPQKHSLVHSSFSSSLVSVATRAAAAHPTPAASNAPRSSARVNISSPPSTPRGHSPSGRSQYNKTPAPAQGPPPSNAHDQSSSSQVPHPLSHPPFHRIHHPRSSPITPIPTSQLPPPGT
jgi:hypothetical protein